MRTSAFTLLHSLVVCSTILLFSLEASAGQCLSHQRSLLLQFKNSLKFESNYSVQWNHSSDCCTWDGVTCQEGRVVGLQLSNKLIIGGLTDNSSLFHFKYLKTLDLSFNKFSTPIPSRFGNLTSLNHLNLSTSSFVGKIPIEISRLTNLVTLDLSISILNQIPLLKVDQSNWRMLLQNLTKLQQLYLDGVNMSETGKEWSRVFSSSPPKLQVLSLSDCSLSGPIDHSLLKLQSLSVIHLSGNNLSAPIPRFISNFSKLSSLHLRGCGLYGKFPKEIFQVPTLETINVANNELLQGSLPEFSPNNSLQSLVLSFTSFSGRLPTSISNLTKLSMLDLSDSLFNGTLPNFMFTKLVSLDLSANRFIGPIPSFRMAERLTTIRLSHNGLSGTIPSAHWEGLPKLAFIDLRHNIFNGAIPPSLFKVPSLEQIDLSYNQFNGQFPEFPNPSSSMLRVLDLSSNNLEGPIPMSMFKLKYLVVLSLSFNKFNGTIQLDILKGLVELAHLDLSYNNLSVTIVNANSTAWSSFPKNISTLFLASCKISTFPNLKNRPELVQLDLSNNEIHGAVPSWIWDLGRGGLYYLNLSNNFLDRIQEPYAFPAYLDTLDLHSNQIYGKMPTLPPFSAYIDFSHNNFYSSIPPDIGGKVMTSIIFLSISHNGLTGVIPESLCNTGALLVLDLSSNNLSGRIPECMSTMSTNLAVLNLRRNDLSGAIPDSFSVDDCGLRTLDLNGNSIQGKIPKSLAYCTKLEVLDIGNNNMIDGFPCFLKKISTLQVLILRSNKFHGSIGCSNKTDTSWAMLQIIDLAHNIFSGQLPGHSFFTNWKAMMSSAKDNAQEKLNHLQVPVLEMSKLYYEDSTTITIKGQETYLVKILTIDICIDFSSNNFNGQIPEKLGNLSLLYVLNFSNNALPGTIPWSLGKLQSLESLDLSRNELSGSIPASLANLNFLSHLNLSFNKLVGMIPSGSQIQTFSAKSFMGNQGLYGCPLTTNCTSLDHSTPNVDKHHSVHSTSTKIDWNFLTIEFGFVVGFGSLIGPLVFCKRWRNLYFETIEDVAFKILPFAVTRKWLSWTTAW